MPSINLDFDYFSHPKTMRLVGLLGRGSESLPLRMWTYCGKFHPDTGEFTGYSVREIESAIGWWGKEGDCLRALVRVVYLDKDGDTYRVHDWLEHQGHLLAYKERAKKAAFSRWSKNASSMQQGMNEHAPSNALSMQFGADQDIPPDARARGSAIPSTEKEAVEWAAMAAVPDWFAKEKFDEMEGVNWVAYGGRAVTNWRNWVASEWSRQKRVAPEKLRDAIKKSIQPGKGDF